MSYRLRAVAWTLDAWWKLLLNSHPVGIVSTATSYIKQKREYLREDSKSSLKTWRNRDLPSHVATRRVIRCLGDTVTAECISNIINYRPNKRSDFLATTVCRILACQEKRSGKLAMLSSSYTQHSQCVWGGHFTYLTLLTSTGVEQVIILLFPNTNTNHYRHEKSAKSCKCNFFFL